MLIAVGPEIIWLFGGNEYASAQYVIPPIVEALVFSFTYTAFTNIEFYFDKNKFVMFASIVASVLNVALNYLDHLATSLRPTRRFSAMRSWRRLIISM